ncbi:TerC family protein [Bryobacter aggregatus]|uniref:TerC family protein n=1 Tax=Bryobacter aggregatus TaxID=360054 RepID=UPI000A6C60AF|nr:TerC family protein [Bryobacter aggregatus]
MFNIVVSDIVLAGDNAVVIAMAVRSLPAKERRLGTLLGAGLAVALRIVLTFFVAQLLNLPYLKLIGGLCIFWIAVKVLVDSEPDEGATQQAGGIWQAMWMILVADITMSLDNVLAVAGASHGNLGLLIFGLGLSIPLVVGASGLLSKLMDRYPIIAILGSAVLGRVGAEMILTDPAVLKIVHLGQYAHYAIQIAAAILVVVIAKLLLRRRSAVAHS